MRDNKILVCYNEPKSIYENYAGKDSIVATDLSEKGFVEQIESIIGILSEEYNVVKGYPVNSNIKSLYNECKSYQPNAILNLIESVEGNSHFESYCAGLFDILGISYTGNNGLTLGNCLFKQRTKRILIGSGIPTPNYQVALYKSNEEFDSKGLQFPMIVKLLSEDASIGISENSVVNNSDELSARMNYLFKNFKQDLLVEEYIDGRELNVSILGNEVLPISEISFKGLSKGLPKIITYEAKWSPESEYYKHTLPICPAKLPKRVTKEINRIALESYKAMGCRDYARVDVRLTKDNRPFVIEVNPNPDISPDSGFARSSAAAGISYEYLIKKLIELSLLRSR
ncbi:MAG: ATP-grasp domain-containing protein [Ignavibacteriales bacterium]|jgi:D-alanine-D-alanine ligase|nr:MAG: ATP-grasp domain-containing protein [Ignavibacteriales bacterium]